MSTKNYIFGFHPIESLLKKDPQRITELFIQEKRHDTRVQTIIQLAKSAKIKMNTVPLQELDRLTAAANHQGVVALSQNTKKYSEDDLETILQEKKKPFFLILDCIQDPHNMGACLRTADAAGVDAVIAPRDKSVGLTPVVSKVASGAAETIPFIQVTNLARTLRFLKDQGVWIYGGSHDAEQTIYKGDFTSSVAIVMGAEGTGLRRLTQEHCDSLFRIPMQGAVSSLNVSVATGIFLFEVVRQRQELIKK